MLTERRKLQELIRDNMSDFYKKIGDANPDIELQENDAVTRYLIGIPHPMMNRVLRTTEAFHDQAGDRVRDILGLYQSQSLPILWLEWNVDGDKSLAPVLEEQGFQRIDFMPGMALNLDDMKADASVISDFEIKRVADEADFAVMGDILRASFGFPAIVGDAFLQFMRNVGFAEDCPIQNYMGWLDGRPVSCVTAFRHGDTVGIYNVATEESVRGKGIGAATTLHPLLLEREKGCQTAILHASKLGHGVYKRIGFEDYVQVDLFLHM